MKMFTSRPAAAIAAAAVLSMTATPVLARDWGWGGGGYGGYGRHHRHHDRVDAGDIFAGVLILGGIAAIASAASNADKVKRERDYRYSDPAPRPDPRDDSPRYGEPRGSARDYPGGDTRGASEMGSAVDACVAEIERGERRVDSVENVGRDPEGWRVDGRLSSGSGFSCTIDRDGRVRRASVDGRAA